MEDIRFAGGQFFVVLAGNTVVFSGKKLFHLLDDDFLRGLDRDMILTMADKGIKTIDDLADLAADELIEILGENTISVNEANKIIMAARQHWFDDENKTDKDAE